MTSTPPVRSLYRDVTRAARLGLVINGLLALVKLVGGIASGSFALVSDALNSLGDVVSSSIILLALRVAQTPPDAEHPYGHTRAEAIAGSNVAVLVIVSALAVAWEAVQRFGAEHTVPPPWALWIAGCNVFIKEALYRYKVRVGRRTGSQAIIANAWDHRGDALCSLAVLIGLATVRMGGADYAWADPAAALVVSAAIVWSGVALFRTSASELMDVQAPEEFLESVRRIALADPVVRRVETLWVRKSGLEYFADIHIEVDPELTVAQGHRIGHEMKDRLLAELPQLRDVLVHLEPCSHDEASRPARHR